MGEGVVSVQIHRKVPHSAAHLWTPVELQSEIIPHLSLLTVTLRNPGMSVGWYASLARGQVEGIVKLIPFNDWGTFLC